MKKYRLSVSHPPAMNIATIPTVSRQKRSGYGRGHNTAPRELLIPTIVKVRETTTEISAMECHLKGMLDRDQRTAKTRVVQEESTSPQCCCCCSIRKSTSVLRQTSPHLWHQDRSEPSFSAHTPSSSNSCKCHRCARTFTGSCWRCKGILLRSKTLRKFQNVLLVGTYLSLLAFRSSSASPINMSGNCDNETFWIDPCGPKYEPTVGNPASELITSQINNTIVEGNSLLNAALQFKEDFINMKTEVGWSQYEAAPYPWMPQLPNMTDDREFNQHLKKLMWQDSLLEMYENLQIIAVAFEELHNDSMQDKNESIKALETTNIKYHFKILLCELLEAIRENNLIVKGDVQRTVMPVQMRNLRDNESRRTMRDWVIWNELVNVIEYTVRVCTFLRDKSNSKETA